MIIKSAEEYQAALQVLEQMFGNVDEEDDECQFEILLKALEIWEAKTRTHLGYKAGAVRAPSGRAVPRKIAL